MAENQLEIKCICMLSLVIFSFGSPSKEAGDLAIGDLVYSVSAWAIECESTAIIANI